jgi:microcystin-dependent protein
MGDPYVGEIRRFSFQAIPEGWLLCDGSTLLISHYLSLHTVIGATYGGDGRNTFQLPDLRGRAPLQWGGAPGPVGAKGNGTGAPEPYFTLTHAICTDGVFPSRGSETT